MDGCKKVTALLACNWWRRTTPTMSPEKSGQDRHGASPASGTRSRLRRRTLRPHRGLFAIVLVGAGLLAAACGGGSSPPGVASLGTSITTTTVPAAQNTNDAVNYKDALAYSGCMRSHGVQNFPDPNSGGNFINEHGDINGQQVDTSSPQYATAQKDCQHLLPNGGELTPAEQQQALSQALKYVQCIRTHGVPNMPDPITEPGGVANHLPPGVTFQSPQFLAAQQACRSLQPGGGGAP